MLAAGGFLASQYLRPLPAVAAHLQYQAERQIGTTPSLPWPSVGSAAVSLKGFGLLGAQGNEAPRPIASTTKIMTALLILENHPLNPGETGPVVTITPQDVADYQKAATQDQSVVPVTAGEKLSELQLLQALLIPLGKDGNIGIKTGSTDEAGGCFVSASIQQVAGKPMEVYAAVLGQDERDDALDATVALSRAVAANYHQTRVLSRTEVMATLTPSWGDPTPMLSLLRTSICSSGQGRHSRRACSSIQSQRHSLPERRSGRSRWS